MKNLALIAVLYWLAAFTIAIGGAAAVGAAYPPGAVKKLPPGYEIWLGRVNPKSGLDETWKSSGHWIEWRTPDGPVEFRLLESGAIEVRSFGLQADGGMGVVDRVVRFEFRTMPAKPAE